MTKTTLHLPIAFLVGLLALLPATAAAYHEDDT